MDGNNIYPDFQRNKIIILCKSRWFMANIQLNWSEELLAPEEATLRVLQKKILFEILLL